MTRTGRVSDGRLASAFPQLFAELCSAGVIARTTPAEH
jgi:hypothetical protein